jgi:hypothetical protein
MEETPVPNSEHYWFKIGRILDFDERQKFAPAFGFCA